MRSKFLWTYCNRILDVEGSRSRRVHVYEGALHVVDSGKSTLLSLLRKFRDRKASDPRDKVYALLGLVRTPQSRLPMIPDYSLSEVEVFRQATLECIYETGSLSIFSTELGRKFRTDLPSWVPDWGAPRGFTYQTRATAVELYNACSSRDLATETSVRPIGEKALQVEYSSLGPIH
jgi:hypothetical protein